MINCAVGGRIFPDRQSLIPVPHVSLIISTYNRLDLLEACVASARATLPPDLTVEWLIVDDGSSDGTREWLEAQADDSFRFFAAKENLGYAAANNLGAQMAQSPVLAFLNNDLVFRPGWLSPMLAVLQAQPAAFAVGNLQFKASDHTLDHAGIVFTEWGHPFHFRRDLAQVRSRRECEFPAVTFACALVHRERFLALGGFDPRFHNGFEDVDLCLRARRRGWRCFVANHSEVDHHISASPGRKSAEERNAKFFLGRWQDLASTWGRDWEEREWLETRALANAQPDARPPGPYRVLIDLAELLSASADVDFAASLRRWLDALKHAAHDAFSFELLAPDWAAADPRPWRDCGCAWWSPDAASRASFARALQIDVIFSPLGRSGCGSADVPEVGGFSGMRTGANDGDIDQLRMRCVRVRCDDSVAFDDLVRHHGFSRDQLFIAPGMPGGAATPSPAALEAGARETITALRYACESFATAGISWRWHDATKNASARAIEDAPAVGPPGSTAAAIFCHFDEPARRDQLTPLILIKGWAFAGNGAVVARMFVRTAEGRWEGAYGLARPDVAAAHGQAPGSERSGFELRVPRPEKPGPIVLEVLLADGRTHELAFV